MKRSVTAELLDDDLGTPQEVSASLRDLRHINDWFGGTRTTMTLLRRVARRARLSKLSVLEVGSGLGDVPLTAQRALARQGIEVQVTLLDRLWSHLPASGAASVSGDAMRLPFRGAAFDVVSCSLFAHHFDPPELPGFVTEALRVSRQAVLINDLVRTRMHLSLVYLGLPLFRSPITWNDAPASVRRAYTVNEMRSILAKVPARRVDISRHFLFRMGVLIWK
jgi:ubiquinone/menaquinone biosynthesis C-methylase UbiE